MNKFCYTAVKELQYINKKTAIEALNTQINQEWRNQGNSDTVGEILVKRGALTSKQRDTVLRSNLMEPNIRWDSGTLFAKMLNIEKAAKQAVGDYVGKIISKMPRGRTVFMGNSSAVYYAFRGMIKHDARVNVQTIHAAILAAFPSVKSKIKSVSTVWKGHVDLDDALIEPPDLGDAHMKSGLGFLDGLATHVIISAHGFDARLGPLVAHPVAREISRLALQSNTSTLIIIDHSKVRTTTSAGDNDLLFEMDEWNSIRSRGHVKVIVNCHPNMPESQSDERPDMRQENVIRDDMKSDNIDDKVINEVLHYYKWTMRVRDIFTEVSLRRTTEQL